MDARLAGLREDVAVMRHFRSTFSALGDERVMRLLSSLDSDVLDNSEVRSRLGVSRKAAWCVLSRLVEVGVVQRHGHTYTMAPGTYDLARAFASALKGLVGGTRVRESSLSLLLAAEGPAFVKWAYDRGRIDRAQLAEYERELREAMGPGR